MKRLLQSSYCVQWPMSTVEPTSSWEEDRKFVLRAWCLVFIILATVMLLSVLDGRMAYLHGSYTGYVGFWTNCEKYTCADLRQVTVLIHMSMGLMILAMILSLVLLLAMGFSFRPALRRLSKTDLIFSTLSSFTGILSYLNYMGMWGKGTPSMERRMSYRRWASLQNTRKSLSLSEPPPSLDAGSKHNEDLSV
ncbi:uncharacterized protein [Ovis canadensis]|uniref:uncharacterized protein isoform X2 n=1 Tax=Ovis canadensis TaxID=37174 RepID=UPI003751F942